MFNNDSNIAFYRRTKYLITTKLRQMINNNYLVRGSRSHRCNVSISILNANHIIYFTWLVVQEYSSFLQRIFIFVMIAVV